MDHYVLGSDVLAAIGHGHGGGHGGHGHGFGGWGGGWDWGDGPVVDVDVLNFDESFKQDLKCSKYDADGNCIEYVPTNVVGVDVSKQKKGGAHSGRPAWQTALIVVGSLLGAGAVGYGAYRGYKHFKR